MSQASGAETQEPGVPSTVVRLDRDSVCAGDDVASHTRELRLAGTATIGALLAKVRRLKYLASIAGGRATWLVEVAGPDRRCIGVVAEEWEAWRLTIPPDTPLRELGGAPLALYFRYWCQADPDRVLRSVREGTPLPPRHG